MREGLRDVFGDCEEDFGEGEARDLMVGWLEGFEGVGLELV